LTKSDAKSGLLSLVVKDAEGPSCFALKNRKSSPLLQEVGSPIVDALSLMTAAQTLALDLEGLSADQSCKLDVLLAPTRRWDIVHSTLRFNDPWLPRWRSQVGGDAEAGAFMEFIRSVHYKL
jgi:hypothetical protein